MEGTLYNYNVDEICNDIIRSKPKSKPLLLKKKGGLYNVRHIKDSEIIELERRVSPISHPPPQPDTVQGLVVAPVIVESKKY